MQTIEPTDRPSREALERHEFVTKTISDSYQHAFENQHPSNQSAFAEQVANALIAAGISRSGEPLTDQVDMVYLHVEAHDEWYSFGHKLEHSNFTFGDYLAGLLVEKGFFLDESRAA